MSVAHRNQHLLTSWLTSAASPARQHADEHALTMLIDAINQRPEKFVFFFITKIFTVKYT